MLSCAICLKPTAPNSSSKWIVYDVFAGFLDPQEEREYVVQLWLHAKHTANNGTLQMLVWKITQWPAG
jgi:hypothetical protein